MLDGVRNKLMPAASTLLIFAALSFATFGSILLDGSHRVLGSPECDVVMQFVPWRAFGFGEMRKGNFPLWNPFIFGGTPYFAGFQAALLYPPNWIHLFLSVEAGINWGIAFHVFAAGYFTYLWCRLRRNSGEAALLAGMIYMFCGPFFLHIYAGHLANLAVMVWAPLLMAAIEQLASTGNLKWMMLGMLAVAMQILGGHPQYLYYTGIIAILYAALLAIGSRHRLALAGGFAAIYAGAAAITAVQLLSGLQAAAESVRSGGTSWAFASRLALPPENIFTLIAPTIFGSLDLGAPAPGSSYFGRSYLWEASLFCSVTGVLLAMAGAVIGRKKTWRLSVICAIALILALGRYVPIYTLLYRYLPEYSSFRGVAKFSFALSLFLAVLAAEGFDLLAADTRRCRRLAWIAGSAAVAIAAIAILLGPLRSGAATHLWSDLMSLQSGSTEAASPQHVYHESTFLSASAWQSAGALAWSSATFAVVAGILVAAGRWRAQLNLLLLCAAVELLSFAHANLMASDQGIPMPAAWLDAIHAAAADVRVINAPMPNDAELLYLDTAMQLGFNNVWGYDPVVLKRYAEACFASQGSSPATASQYLSISGGPAGFLQMLRCGLILEDPKNPVPTIPVARPLAVAQIVPNWIVQTDSHARLSCITSPAFDPRQLVVLESSPGITPDASAIGGSASVIASSTDSLELRAQTARPALLLITNNYSGGWIAQAMDDSSQSRYTIMPADHTLMAIPLQAGAHHLRIEYLPLAFRVGKWISIASCLAYVAGQAYFFWPGRPNMSEAGVGDASAISAASTSTFC
jgi:hypothetical protein